MDWRRELMGGLSSGININNYLTIEALEDGLTASLSVNACEYCIDGNGIWKTLAANTTTQSINIGHTLSFRGELIPTSSEGIGTFTISKQCNLKGNCMSILFGDNAADNYSLSGKSYAFCKLFTKNSIVSVSKAFLPATTLAEGCYYSMFSGCTSLTTAPELPATTLADDCYGYMFSSCSSLINAPELPATTLKDECYGSMFYNCTSLTTAPELPALYAPKGCYDSMFQSCKKLINAPALPATSLGIWCYYSMFEGCSSLITAPSLPATIVSHQSYEAMFRSCINLINAPALPATTLAPYCYQYMFYNCIKLTTAPELPATTLAAHCYNSMFYGCTKLNYIKMLATDVSINSCLLYWVNGVASTGTFVKNSEITSIPTATSGNDYAGIPEGWTVKDHIFTFTFDGDTYTAEYNMTIAEWIESDYNTGGYYIDGDFIYGPNGSSDSCFPSDIIEEGDTLAANAPCLINND